MSNIWLVMSIVDAILFAGKTPGGDLSMHGSAVLARRRLREDALLSVLASDEFRCRARPDLVVVEGPPNIGDACSGAAAGIIASGVMADGGPPATMCVAGVVGTATSVGCGDMAVWTACGDGEYGSVVAVVIGVGTPHGSSNGVTPAAVKYG